MMKDLLINPAIPKHATINVRKKNVPSNISTKFSSGTNRIIIVSTYAGYLNPPIGGKVYVNW